MPDFENHEQAKNWFLNEFKDRFSSVNHDIVNGKKVFYYHIIKDHQVYNEYMNSFEKPDHEITNLDTFSSYSTVEITEDGDVSLSI